VIKVKVVFSLYCPACRALLNFDVDEEGNIIWGEMTPFREALSWVAMAGGQVRFVSIGTEHTPEVLSVLAAYGPSLKVPAAFGNKFGVWSPVPLDLTAEEYYAVLVGLKPKASVRKKPTAMTYLKASVIRRYMS